LRRGEPDAAQFANDIAIVDRVFSVLPLETAAARMSEGRLPARAACITFDDGYANNFELAAPILEKAGVPATFFVTGGALDTGVMWNDLVIEAVARRRGPLNLASTAGLEEAGLAGEALGVAFVLRLLERLKFLPVGERWAAAERLYRDNVDGDLPRLMMSREMVGSLARRGFDIGGHTLTHPILQVLGEAEARAEIDGCSRWIRDVTGRAPTSFAYPNGKPGRDFSAPHGKMAAEAGFTLAVSTEWKVAHRGTDVFNIPRVGPWWRLQRPLADGFLRVYLDSYRG
jgi:peptidoglycan/xylan/chitin deacetylase (PgdA/CDA1 family)